MNDKYEKNVIQAIENSYKNSPLCHYTTLDTLFNIIQNIEKKRNDFFFTLWASSIFAMNDSEEMMYGYDLLWNILPEIERELNIQKEYKISNMWDNIKGAKRSRRDWNKIMKEQLYNEDNLPYILSIALICGGHMQMMAPEFVLSFLNLNYGSITTT